jgi:hypothetical protein
MVFYKGVIVLSKKEIQAGLEKLSPNVPWCHYYDFGHGIESVTKNKEPYYTKARGLKKIGVQVLESIPHITKKGNIKRQTVLDLACAEGVHSNEFAKAGAKKVVGLEGRQMYVDRSNFAKDALGLDNVEYRLGDVRHITPEETGIFDIVLFFGILHHLDASDWLPMLKKLRAVTKDTMVLYTHTSEEGCLKKFGYKLSEELTTDDGYKGRFYREHPDDADAETRKKRNRNSLDNTFSFWPREDDLIKGLLDAGFTHVSRQMWPNPFGRPSGEFRVLYVCH